MTEPMYWRIVLTDTELPTGIAPVCPQPDVHAMMHGGGSDDEHMYYECYECCAAELVLECWSEHAALEVLAMLNRLNVEMPS